MASKEELACVYSALILADDDVPVTAEKISTILKAANVEVETFWPTLFAKALQGIKIKDFIRNIGSAAPAAAAPAAAPAAAAGKADAPAAPKKEEKKKEPEKKEEEEEDMGFGLFD